MPLSRRRFMRETALAAGGLDLAGTARAERDIPMNTARPLFISTWPFGKAANEQSLRTAEQGGSVLDAVERGIHVAEADASNPSVGLGGIPNARGVVQLDACIMDGEGQRAGSVAAIEGILHPISVARRVMDETKHVMLAGEGARQFALEQGFASVELLTEERRKAWEEWREKQGAADNHDTIALLGLDADGRLAGGCSTSGWGYKLPGRVGDSPIIGSGLYVDGGVGAAGATGLGENVMRYCATFLAVEYMRQGAAPGGSLRRDYPPHRRTRPASGRGIAPQLRRARQAGPFWRGWHQRGFPIRRHLSRLQRGAHGRWGGHGRDRTRGGQPALRFRSRLLHCAFRRDKFPVIAALAR